MQLKFLETWRKRIGGCIYNPVRDKWAMTDFLSALECSYRPNWRLFLPENVPEELS